MKIISSDSFDREGPLGNDILIATNVDEYWGKMITEKGEKNETNVEKN